MIWTRLLLLKLNKKQKIKNNSKPVAPKEKQIEKFSTCPKPNGKPCDLHKIDDEEGRWIFCNSCQKEWAR